MVLTPPARATPKKRDRVLGEVRGEDPHHLTGLEPAGLQPGGDAAREHVELADT